MGVIGSGGGGGGGSFSGGDVPNATVFESNVRVETQFEVTVDGDVPQVVVAPTSLLIQQDANVYGEVYPGIITFTDDGDTTFGSYGKNGIIFSNGGFGLTIAPGTNTAARTLTLTAETNLTLGLDNGSFAFGNTVQFPDGAKTAPSMFFASDTGVGFYRVASGALAFARANEARATFQGSNAQFYVSSNWQIGWSSGTDTSLAGPDTGLVRSAAGVVKITDGSTGDGRLRVHQGSNTSVAIGSDDADGETGFYFSGDSIIAAINTGKPFAIGAGNGVDLKVGSSSPINWASTTDVVSGVADTGLARVGGSHVRATNGSTGLGYFLSGQAVANSTVGVSVSTTNSGYLYTNSGDTDGSTYTLTNNPTIGEQWQFYSLADPVQTIRINASSGETIRDGTSSGTSIVCTAVGDYIKLVAVSNGSGATWGVVAKIGTWTLT